MDFLLEKSKIQGPAPGTFEANILRSITVPYQEIVTSGGQYPPPEHPSSPPPSGPAIVIKLEGLSKLPSFGRGLEPVAVEEDRSAEKGNSQDNQA
jgi:hypothetical protein